MVFKSQYLVEADICLVNAEFEFDSWLAFDFFSFIWSQTCLGDWRSTTREGVLHSLVGGGVGSAHVVGGAHVLLVRGKS